MNPDCLYLSAIFFSSNGDATKFVITGFFSDRDQALAAAERAAAHTELWGGLTVAQLIVARLPVGQQIMAGADVFCDGGEDLLGHTVKTLTR